MRRPPTSARNLPPVLALTCSTWLLLHPTLAHSQPPSQICFDALNAPEIDDSKIGMIENVTLVRETARLQIRSGVIHFFQPTIIDGKSRVTGGIFVGRGTFSHRPPTEIERRQLALVTGADSVRGDFEVLYLRFGDDTFEQLAPQVTWNGERFNHPEPKKAFCEEFTKDWVAHAILQSMTFGAEPGFFYAHVGPVEDLRKPWLYVVNPMATEAVWFAQRQPRDVGTAWETLNRFRLASEYEAGLEPDWKRTDPLRPEHYAIACVIGDDGMMRLRTKLRVTVLRGPLSSFGASLSPALRVKRVSVADSSLVSYEQSPESGHLLVFVDPPLAPSDSRVFEFEYTGRALEKDWFGYYVPGAVDWYPRLVTWNDATFDLLFTAPTGYEVVAVGKKLEQKDAQTTQWSVTVPTEFAAFNVGKFEHHVKKAEADSLPTVTAYVSTEGTRAKAQSLRREPGSPLKHGGGFVALEVADAAKFFSWLFGRSPVLSLAATEVPASYGISFPGLLHLAGATFYHESHEGKTEAFRSHEVAHQWWGNAVKPASYHDAWLSEGFAEYASYRYAGWAHKDDKWRYSLLEEARTALIANQKAFLKERIPAAPLWLGYRQSSSRTESAYWLITYQKGAYVLHMLSSMLLDFKTMHDPEFVDLMRDFYSRYNGRRASTEDFRKCVEEHVGMDMGWFFDEWVYGTEIPTYRLGWGHSPVAAGGYQLQATVRQSNVSPDFRMYVTLRVEFADGQFAHFRVLVSKPEETFSLRLPMEPTRVVLNDLNSVLAEVEQP